MLVERIYYIILITWLILSAGIFISLFFIVAPYGRHMRKGWGPALDSRLAWIIMEAWSPIIFALCFILGKAPLSVPIVIFLLLWEAHYIHRAFIYPFSLKNSNDKMPLSVVLLGIFFNLVNASLNGYYVFTLSGGYPNLWLADPRFIIGAAVFVCGFIINRQADFILSKLRKPGEKGYSIPRAACITIYPVPTISGRSWCGWDGLCRPGL